MANLNINEALTAAAPTKHFGKYQKFSAATVIATYFLSLFIWVSPDGPFRQVVLYFLNPLISATSIGQGWSVFAPEVRDINYHETALIRFADGSSKLYEFPRMEKLDYLQRFRQEKFRKMFFDCMPWPEFSLFLDDFARYVARCNTSINNPPVMVTLLHHSRLMPNADPDHWVNRDSLPEHTDQKPLYVYRVEVEDWQ